MNEVDRKTSNATDGLRAVMVEASWVNDEAMSVPVEKQGLMHTGDRAATKYFAFLFLENHASDVPLFSQSIENCVFFCQKRN